MKAQWLNSCDMVSTCGLNSIMAALQMFKIVCWYLSLSPFDCGKYGIESINLIWLVWWKDSRMFGWKALSLPPMMALMFLLIAYNKFRVEINASITVTFSSISSKKKKKFEKKLIPVTIFLPKKLKVSMFTWENGTWYFWHIDLFLMLLLN